MSFFECKIWFVFVLVVGHYLLPEVAASYSGSSGGGGLQLFMKSGKKDENMILLGKPCSGIPMMIKSGKGKKRDLILIPNQCKKEYPTIVPVPVMVPNYGGHGGSGGGGGGMSYDHPTFY